MERARHPDVVSVTRVRKRNSTLAVVFLSATHNRGIRLGMDVPNIGLSDNIVIVTK